MIFSLFILSELFNEGDSIVPMHKLLVNNCYLIHVNFAVCIFDEKLTEATSRRTPANVHLEWFVSSYGHLLVAALPFL